MMLKIAHLVPYIGRRHGGPVHSLSVITRHQQKLGHKVSVFSVIRQNDEELMGFDPGVNLMTSEKTILGEFRYSPELLHILEQEEYDIIHSHGLWTNIARIAAELSNVRNVPHLLSPCGMLQSKAMKRSWWKKLPVRLWFQERALHNATCIQAKSEMEYLDLRQLGLENPIAIVPNPVCVPINSTEVVVERYREIFKIPKGMKCLLFLGRIHPIKGIIRLIEAWANQRRFHDDWRLILAGPMENAFLSTAEKHIDDLECRKSIILTGDLCDQKKWGALEIADLFVMPSDFENFCLAIAEALTVGIPVITTKGTPWKIVKDQGAGWWVEPTTKAISTVLQEAMELSDDQRRRMGERGKALSKRLQPEKVVKELLSVYQWMLRNSPCPETVRC